jgi:thioredoxin-like negative regulator of GroEL
MAEAHAAAGLISNGEGDIEEALTHFENALEINPNYSEAYTWMANILENRLGRYAEVFAMREKALRLDPLSFSARFNYVGELIERGRVVEADRELEKLAPMAPAWHAAIRGMRLSLGGSWANGALGLLDALRIDPENHRVRAWLAFWFALLGLEQEALADADDVDPDIMRLLGRPRQALAAARARFAEDPVSEESRGQLGLALAGAGDYAEARPHLEASWQRDGGVIVGPMISVDEVAALIVVRQAAGEADRIADLLAAIRDNVRRYREAGIANLAGYGSPDYEDGLARYLSGDEQRGLALIARAVEDGYFIPPREAYLQDLYDHPDFAAVRQMQEARQARERKRFLAIVCSDNPYAAVWQPADDTCQRFAAQTGN